MSSCINRSYWPRRGRLIIHGRTQNLLRTPTLFLLSFTTCETTPFVTVISSKYAACSSSNSWSTFSILVLSNVLFLCQIRATFVSCTQRSRLAFVSYSCVFVSRYSCAFRFLLNSCHVHSWFAFGSYESSGAFVSHSQLFRGTVFSNFIWQYWDTNVHYLIILYIRNSGNRAIENNNVLGQILLALFSIRLTFVSHHSAFSSVRGTV